jgi:hypothetical protein
LSVTGIFAQGEGTVIYSNDFENTPLTPEEVENGFDYDDLWVRCFHEEASWDVYVATGEEAISGNQSFCLNVINPGSEPWGLQFILNRNQMPLEVNSNYRITFKIKSETPNNLVEFRVEGWKNFQQFIEIQEANEIREVSFVMNTKDPDESLPSNANGFKWFFGQITNAGKIWIDDVVITLLPLPDFSDLFEDFNFVTLDGATIGDFEFCTFAGSWDYSLEVDPQDINNKFLRLQPIETAEWWAYQFRTLKYSVKQGKKYRVSFKAKSNVSNTVKFKLEAATNFEKDVPLSGQNTFETITFETTPAENEGPVGVVWALGSPTVAGSTVWLDDIEIVEVIIPELTEISENFETNTINENVLGDFTFGTFAGSWTYTIENDPQNADNKCLCLEPSEAAEWWAYQFRTANYRTLEGKQYTVSFKAKSPVDNAFCFRAEGNVTFDYNVELSGDNEFETFTFDTSPMDKEGVTTFLFAFGQPAEAGNIIYLDDIVIKPKSGDGIRPILKETKIPVLFFDNRLKFPANLQADVQVYDLRGILITQGKVGNGFRTLTVQNGHRILIVKIIDKQGNADTSKVMLSR